MSWNSHAIYETLLVQALGFKKIAEVPSGREWKMQYLYLQSQGSAKFTFNGAFAKNPSEDNCIPITELEGLQEEKFYNMHGGLLSEGDSIHVKVDDFSAQGKLTLFLWVEDRTMTETIEVQERDLQVPTKHPWWPF